MKKILLYSFLIMILLIQNLSIYSQDEYSKSWSQFRGNNRNGISEEINLLDKWPESGPELVWKKDLGTGFSELIVSDGFVYTMYGDTAKKGGFEYITAFDLNSGDEIWKTQVDSLYIEIDGWGHGPRSTPAADENNIYCLSGNGKLTALSKKDGTVKWKVDFIKDLGGQLPRWGYSTSPLLAENMLIVETGGKDSKTYAAFNKETGKTIWEKGIGNSSYSSPLYAKINNKVHFVFVNDTMLYSFDEKGNENWSYRMPLRGPESMPVFIEPNKIFVSMVSTAGSFIIEIEDNTVKEFKQNNKIKCLWSTSCHKDGYIYSISNAKLLCNSIETGETKWAVRGFGKGSLIIVDNKLLVLSDRGVLKQIEANPNEYIETGSVQALEGKSWTAPSFSDGRVFVRNLTQMSSYIIKK